MASSAAAFVVPLTRRDTLAGAPAVLSTARRASLCPVGLRRAPPCTQVPTSARTALQFVFMQGGGMAADEDDWYDSEKWESFRKSGARVSGARERDDEKERKSQSQQGMSVDVSEREKDQRQGTDPRVEWLRIAGCDVCLPKERTKPIDGPRFTGLVHFTGGAFVGTLPRQAYGVLIESLVAKGRLVVVATPCSGLAGMDHYKAAYESAFKFQTACSVLRTDLGADIFDADELPTIGVAHSLGCKVQVLMNSIQDTRDAAGRERAANVHLAFNNFAASESVPIIKELNKLQKDLSRGLAAASPIFEQISSLASDLKSTSAFKDVLGTSEANQAFSFFENLAGIGKAAAANAGSEILEEFSPAPEDTMRLLAEEYTVSRNLVIKFLDDAIDQSIPLCESLREKFTGPKGSGGRLDLKRLPGSHVTANTPDLRNLAEGRANLNNLEELLGEVSREEAKKKMQEVETCAEVVVEFLKDEFARDRLRPPGGKRIRLGGTDP